MAIIKQNKKVGTLKRMVDKTIAELICLAQISSDAGKGICSLSIRSKEYKKAIQGYCYKDEFIRRAIKLIQNNISNWRYYITKDYDQNGHMSKVIYFTLNDEKRFLQISFHSFAGGFIKELAAKESGTRLFWDHKGSRLSAYRAAKACKCHVGLR